MDAGGNIMTHPTHIVFDRPSTYLALLNEQLEIRAREYGQAWLTPDEDAWVRANDLHLRHHYSVIKGDGTEKARERVTSKAL
jgi:hypothetical protein